MDYFKSFSKFYKWIAISLSYLAIYTALEYLGVINRIFEFAQTPSVGAEILLGLLFLHAIEESTAFISIYYPGTLVIGAVFYLAVPNKISSTEFILTLLTGIAIGSTISFLIGRKLRGSRRYRLIDIVLDFLARYKSMWVFFSAWNPNWLAVTMCGLGYKGSKFLGNWLLGLAASSLFCLAYVSIGTNMRQAFSGGISGHQYLVTALIFLFGALIELFEKKD
jgi:membrane protein DedA with SNARE-associated domain